ncbi:MAG: 3-deoxy-manno-octulosonate cytidylyltransferase [Chlamydiales bacterium]|nr:3-deoxy-manno-octulosonate cytidylyltransferase [Chlamydiales bacterium]
MKAICIIPARFNSSRFPGKLLAEVLGKTVLQRTLENALRCKALSQVYVATDHELIAKHIEMLGGQVLWTSPACQNGTLRIIEALKKNPDLQQADIILNVQGDHPCTSPESMEAVVQILKQDPKAVMATSVIPLKDPKTFRSPHVVKCVFDLEQNALYFSRSPIPYSTQAVPKNAYHHIGLYAYRTKFLLSSLPPVLTPLQEEEDLEQLHILEKGFSIKVALTNDPPLAIDTPGDLKAFKAYLAKVRPAFAGSS